MANNFKKFVVGAKREPIKTAVKVVEEIQKRMGVKKIKGKKLRVK